MALNNSPLANFWLHNARIDLRGEKMSKSLGNVIWLKDLVDKYGPQSYRLLILSNNYLQTINYDDEIMLQVVNEWEKIDKAYRALYRKLELLDALSVLPEKDEALMEPFLNAFANNFNTSLALTSLYDLIKTVNKELRNKETTVDTLKGLFVAFTDMLDILGLVPSVKALTPEELNLVKAWQDARTNKDFEKADILRGEITSKGIVL